MKSCLCTSWLIMCNAACYCASWTLTLTPKFMAEDYKRCVIGQVQMCTRCTDLLVVMCPESVMCLRHLVPRLSVDIHAKCYGDHPRGTLPSHHITSHGEDGCRPQWPLYPRNKYLYTTLLLVPDPMEICFVIKQHVLIRPKLI